MILKEQIIKIIADAYRGLALHAGVLDMHRMSDLLENFRLQVKENAPLETWYCLHLDLKAEEQQFLLPVIIKMRTGYLQAVYQNFITSVREAGKDSAQQWTRWKQLYAEALINFYGEIYEPLCNEQFSFNDEKQDELEELKRLNRWILECRWVDAHPLFKKLAAQECLTNYQRACLETIAGQIELYYFADPQQSIETFKKAGEIDKANRRVEKAFAEYELACGNMAAARSLISGLLLKYNDDYALFNLMGDCFKSERNFAAAEQFYYDGSRQNILQTESFSQLIKLYGEEGIFNEKKQSIPEMIRRIKQLESFPQYNNSLYNAYRDAAGSLSANNDNREAEKYYKKAIGLKKDFVTAYIEHAYLKIKQAKFNKAEEILNETLRLDQDCYDTHRALSYLYDTANNREKALEAYEKCNRLRPAWSDQHYNFMGNMYFKTGEFEKALPFYERAIELKPSVSVYKENRRDALVNLARNAEMQANDTEAEHIYQQLAKSGEAADLNELGYYYFMRGRYDDALNYYSRAHEIEPTNQNYLQNLIRAYGDTGKYEQAEELNRKLIEINKESADHMAQLAFYLSAQNKNEEAIKTVEQAYAIDPGNKYVLKTMATVYQKAGNHDKTFELYKMIIDQNPKDDEALNSLGVYYNSRKDYKKAIEYYKKAIAINKKTGIYYDNLGLAYENLSNLQEAEKYYKQYADLEPLNGNALNNLAVVQYKQTKDVEAEKNYLAALNINPENRVYLENLALLYKAMQENNKAIQYFEKVLEVKPDSPDIYNDLGELYSTIGENEKAIEHHFKAISLMPDTSRYYENLGLAYKNAARRQDEKTAYETALSYDKDNAGLLNRLGVWFFEERIFPEAIDYYHKALAIDSDNLIYLENLALALYTDGDTSNDDEAIEVYNKLLRLSPENFNAWNELGILYYRKGMQSNAINAYKEAGKLRPDSAIIYENIGLSYFVQGEYKEAADFYLHALQVGSENKLRLLQDVGDIYHLKLNKNEEAITYYNEALNIHPDAITWKYLAEAYEGVNDIKNATKAKEEWAKLSAVEGQ